MTATTETRLDELEARAAALEARLARVEGPPAPVRSTHPVTAPAPRITPPPAPAPSPSRPAVSLEDLLGGRVMAWVGGVAVVVGVVLLLVIAASSGWIGEEARVLMAAGASLALLAAGIRLHDRRGRTEASLAAAAAGVAGLFASVVVATSAYSLVAPAPGLALAILTGAAATALAIRWAAPGMGALGIVGALAAPAVVGADLGRPETLALVAIAAVSATAALVHQRWDWLAFATFAITTPQWLHWLAGQDRAPLAVVAVAAGFGALTFVAAAGFELRSRAPRLRPAAVVLLSLNALVVAAAGYYGLGAGGVAKGWLVALALVHLGAGLAGARRDLVSHELALVLVALGVILADVAFATLAGGSVLVAGWTAAAISFAAYAARRQGGRVDDPFAAMGLGAHVALALAHAVTLEAPGAELGALALVAAGCFASGRLLGAGHATWRTAVDAAGLAVVAYTTAVALDGAVLTVAWALEAVSLGLLARRVEDELAASAARAFLGGALAHALVALAPPTALIDGLADPLGAAVALGAVALAAALLGRGRDVALMACGALVLLYLASVELVTPFAGRQQGQTLLSALWAVTGVAALLAGLLRNARALRLGALALLGATAGKVFLYDLASLTSLYRVASFIALGLLLLGGAFAWQRLRPPTLSGA